MAPPTRRGFFFAMHGPYLRPFCRLACACLKQCFDLGEDENVRVYCANTRADLAPWRAGYRRRVERDAMNLAEGEAQYLASLAQFSPEQRAAHAVLWYVSDVKNGGHWQFFFNSTGILWDAALSGLREIGAPKCALTLSGAALRAGGSPPHEHAARQSLMQRLSPKFADLDDKLNQTDLLLILRDFIRENRAAFHFVNPATA